MTGETKVRGAEEKDIHTVLVVDDHPLFRRGVCELLALEPAIKVVGEAGTREEALSLIARYEPDLTVLDLNIKGSSGVEILTKMKEEDPSRRVVILTVSDSGDDLMACIKAGADGYFLKDMEPERFLESLKETLDEVHMVVEGVNTAAAAYALSRKHNVEMPIVEEANNILYNGANAREAVLRLMTRDKKGEI